MKIPDLQAEILALLEQIAKLKSEKEVALRELREVKESFIDVNERVLSAKKEIDKLEKEESKKLVDTKKEIEREKEKLQAVKDEEVQLFDNIVKLKSELSELEMKTKTQISINEMWKEDTQRTLDVKNGLHSAISDLINQERELAESVASLKERQLDLVIQVQDQIKVMDKKEKELEDKNKKLSEREGDINIYEERVRKEYEKAFPNLTMKI